MDRPCIVCQENCPTSPKAIYTRDEYITIRDGLFLVKGVVGSRLVLEGKSLEPGTLATGDYFCQTNSRGKALRWKILENTENTLVLSPDHRQEDLPGTGAEMQIQVRLRRPHVDPKLCIGCGICEHECPVRGQRAIRVTAENESRSKEHALLLQ
jgi:Pyruvate/2-oxoacid:ferredoxin oxidoreductase delta subunit